jgi:hypothetical protein
VLILDILSAADEDLPPLDHLQDTVDIIATGGHDPAHRLIHGPEPSQEVVAT